MYNGAKVYFIALNPCISLVADKFNVGRRKERPLVDTTNYVHPDDQVTGKRRKQFEPFMDPLEIEVGLADGSLVQGNLRINKRNRSDAYVTSDHLDGDIYLFGARARNRALEGDSVAVRLLDVEKIWAMKKDRDRKRDEERNGGKKAKTVEDEDTSDAEEEEGEIENGDNEDETDTEADKEDKAKPKYCGEVVGILERAEQTFAGYVYERQRLHTL